MKKVFFVWMAFISFTGISGTSFAEPGPKVSEKGNKHNLSVYNTSVTFHATDSTDPRAQQVCIFCHTPHNAVINQGLWNRKLSDQSFGHYTSSTLNISKKELEGTSDYNEPNGSSRLCLGCHDGVTALGAIIRGSGGSAGTDIAMTASVMSEHDGISNVFDRNKITNHHHPVSFNYAKVWTSLNGLSAGDLPLGQYNFPPKNMDGNVDVNVKLDREGRMQCTTCHDPHQTQDNSEGAPPFWVEPTDSFPNSHDAVCISCHEFPPSSDFSKN